MNPDPDLVRTLTLHARLSPPGQSRVRAVHLAVCLLSIHIAAGARRAAWVHGGTLIDQENALRLGELRLKKHLRVRKPVQSPRGFARALGYYALIDTLRQRGRCPVVALDDAAIVDWQHAETVLTERAARRDRETLIDTTLDVIHQGSS